MAPQLLPPAVDQALSLAISRALAPLRDQVDKLAKSIPGVFSDPDLVVAGPSSSQMGNKRAVKHNAGHLEGFDKLTETFLKSARTLKHAPCREEEGPGENCDTVTTIVDPDGGFPLEGEGVSEDDFSSDEDKDSGRPWRPESHSSQSPVGDGVHSDMFEPTQIYHPRSAEWTPDAKVAEYVVGKIHQPLEREVRNRMRGECPRPSLKGKVAHTPEIDEKLCTFFSKYMRDPKKGIDRSWTW